MAPRVLLADVAEMMRLYENEGYSAADIQRVTGRNIATVLKHLRRVGVVIDPSRGSQVVPNRHAVYSDGVRVCSVCRTSPARFDGKRWYRCFDCVKAYMHGNHRLRKYGLTEEAYTRLLAAQGGTCRICPRTVNLVVDHDHANGEVRGILCHKHNVAIGLLGDGLTDVERAVAYLRGNI